MVLTKEDRIRIGKENWKKRKEKYGERGFKLQPDEISKIFQKAAKNSWMKRKEKYGVSGSIISRDEINKKISEGVKKSGMSKKLKSYYLKQKESPSESELKRREKIRQAMKGREITWADKIGKSMQGNKNGEGVVFTEERKQLISKNSSKTLQKKLAKGERWGWNTENYKHSENPTKKQRSSPRRKIITIY